MQSKIKGAQSYCVAKKYFVTFVEILQNFLKMPINRNALIRYKTIDNCLRRHHVQWTLDDLINACSDALYEYTAVDKIISHSYENGVWRLRWKVMQN